MGIRNLLPEPPSYSESYAELVNFVQEPKTSEEEDFRILKSGSDFNTLNVTLTAKRGDCSSTYREEIQLRQVETEFSLDTTKKWPEENIYCNNDPHKYQFRTQPEGEPDGEHIIKENGHYYFKPLELEAGEYKFTYHDKVITATVHKVPEADFRMIPSLRDNALLVSFKYTGEEKTGKISWDYGDHNNDPHMPIDEMVRNRYPLDTDTRRYTVTMKVLFDTGCTNQVYKEIDMDELIKQAGSLKDGQSMLDYDAQSLENSGRNVLDKYDYNGLSAYRETTTFINESLNETTTAKEFLAGKMNKDLAGTYKKLLDETAARAMEAAKNQDTRAAEFFGKSYLVQLEGLIRTINLQEKDLKKTDPLTKVLAESPKTLKKLNSTKVDIPIRDLEIIVAVHKAEAAGKKNFTKDLDNLTKAVK